MNLQEYQELLRTDLAAHDMKRWTFLSAFRKPEVYYQRLLRRVEYWNAKDGAASRLFALMAKFRLQRLSVRTGLSFPPGVAGPGLSIAHYGSIVVNSRAKIGRFCRIHSATNIGVANGGVPVIGDFVYIGPGAVIYGDITIGDGVVIGANSVVNKSVPAGVTVAGAPAKTIALRDSSTVMPMWFPNYRDRDTEPNLSASDGASS
ncbi:serine O-acetyltransferase [Arthrobacter sp. SAFR-014]|uniref:serine O-acetyltransferase n=1 Tax=unclassified Arthrobacter TaxID=235627 RepID=UPI003F7BC9D1